MASGMKRLGAIILVMFPSAVNTQISWGQLQSRPAAVVLVATLESLSVSATPGPMANGQDGAPEQGSERVEVKTSWALPAHRTTLRLMGGLSIGSQNASGSDGADSAAERRPHQDGRKPVQCQPAADCSKTIQSGKEIMTLMKEAAGESNRADSRTNSVRVVIENPNKSRVAAGRDAARFDIQVEAL